MAIVREILDEDTVRTYSDRGVKIHGGFPEGDYAEAVDPISMNRTYTETEIPIDELDAQDALDQIFGGGE